LKVAEPSVSILSGYSLPFLGDGPLSLIVAGLIGVALVFVAVSARAMARAAIRACRPTPCMYVCTSMR